MHKTSWTVTDDNDDVVVSSGSYDDLPSGTTVNESICLPGGCYSFTIFDSYGDGTCCDHGNRSYALTDNTTNIVLSSEGSSDSRKTNGLCLPGTTP